MDPIFESYTLQHFSALIVFALITCLAIWIGWKSNDRTKMQIGFILAFLAFSIMLVDLIYRLATHTFDILGDLPLFLCDLVVCMLPVIIWKRNRKWLGILYFWAIAGTLQALITPELKSGFPSFEYFRYFIMHAGIVSAVVYCIVVWKINITWRDFLNAVLYVQFYIIGIHLINIMLASNYSYTMKKPDSTTILNFMGAWPWYILVAEIVMIILFLLLMLPFILRRTGQTGTPASTLESGQPY